MTFIPRINQSAQSANPNKPPPPLTFFSRLVSCRPPRRPGLVAPPPSCSSSCTILYSTDATRWLCVWFSLSLTHRPLTLSLDSGHWSGGIGWFIGGGGGGRAGWWWDLSRPETDRHRSRLRRAAGGGSEERGGCGLACSLVGMMRAADADLPCPASLPPSPSLCPTCPLWLADA